MHLQIMGAISLEINPTIVELGPFEIRWYGLLYMFFLLWAYSILPLIGKRKYTGLSGEDLQMFLISGFIAGFIGARLGYMLTNAPADFFTLETFKVWHGGLASYGGLLGVILYGVYFTRSRGIEYFRLADVIIIASSILPCFIRLGNFINQELVGTVTDLPWAFKFEGYLEGRHPVALYALLANLVIFILIWNIVKIRLKPGFVSWLWLGLYAMQRFLLDFFREYDYEINNLSVSQIISIPLFLVALLMLVRGRPWQTRLTMLAEAEEVPSRNCED